MADSIQKLVPWLLIVFLTAYIYFGRNDTPEPPSEIKEASSILTEIEAIGKLELIKYNFQEITEVKQVAKKYLDLFKLDRDSKIVLISRGEAVGCIDLGLIDSTSFTVSNDTIEIVLPKPELCYFRIDLQETRIYSLETGYFIDEKSFIEDAYRYAENELKKSALNSGILGQAYLQAERVLKPFLQNITDKTVIIHRDNSIDYHLEEPR